MYRRHLAWFQELRHPLIFTPGDNEWSDCREPGSGSFVPLERLDRLREIFFEQPRRSLGGAPLPLVSQAGREPFPEFVENARWVHEGFVFATVHLVGSRNATADFPGRSAAEIAASRRRTEAATAWMHEAFAEATALDAAGLVLFFHANPGFDTPVDDDYVAAYEPFLEVLEEEVEHFSRPVLMAQGDDHEFIVDQPLTRRTTGRVLDKSDPFAGPRITAGGLGPRQRDARCRAAVLLRVTDHSSLEVPVEQRRARPIP